MNDFKSNVLKADTLIRPYLRQTPLEHSLALSNMTQSKVLLKCEHLQHTGAFKVRGAFHKLLNLAPQARAHGVVAASSGNHGAAVAYALSRLNIPGTIFVPENASVAKVENIQNYSADLRFYGDDCMLTEMHARAYAEEHGQIYISPYNDPEIIAGQGTLGLEILQQIDNVDVIFVPVGGGGLISGIAGYVKAVSPRTKIIGCLPANSPVMAESARQQKIIDMKTLDTLSDATAGGIEPNAITLGYCQQYVDDYILTTEDEIKNAILLLIQKHRLLVEGASGVALAALLQCATKYQGKTVVAILSGGNISLDKLRSILSASQFC